MKGHVVKVFLDDAEMGELDKARGLVSRSGFIRNKVFTASRVAETEDARPPKGRDVGVAGKTSPVRTQPIAGSNPAPATKPTDGRDVAKTVEREEPRLPLEDAGSTPAITPKPFVMPMKYQNRYCKEHHVMGCEFCAKRILQGVPY